MNYPLFYKLGYKLLKIYKHVKHFKTQIHLQIHFFYIYYFKTNNLINVYNLLRLNYMHDVTT
jgi:hypothetical protein